MAISQWSTSAANNASGVTNINWAEGQAPSTVNNSARQEMADIANWYRNSAEWIDRNDTATYSSGTKVTFSGNLTGIYNIGRRIKTTSSTPGTLYGVITGSSTSGANSVITIDWDSTSVLVNETISDVAIGIISNSTGTQSLDAKNISRINQFGVPTGTILEYASTSAPTGFLYCNGTGYSRSTYSTLFGVVGTSFGSSSTSTFKVPDRRGRVGFGIDNLGGTSANRITSTAADTLGGAVGAQAQTTVGSISGSVSGHALTVDEMPSHAHTVNNDQGGAGSAQFIASAAGSATAVNTSSVGGGSAHTHGDTFAFSGSTMSVLQPGIALNYIIKT